MIVVNPTDIDESNFQSSTIQEPDLTTGEKEWVSSPFDGYDISAEAGSPSKVVNSFVYNIYYVWDSSSNALRFYDRYFNYQGSRQMTHSAATVGRSGVTSNDVISIALDSTWSVYTSSRFSDTKIHDAKPVLNGAGISSIDPVGMFFDRDESSTQSYYLLNKETDSKYVVIKFNGTSVVYQSTLDISTYGTPRDITYRDGRYLILFSDASKTTIVEYDESFSVVVSSNQLTGNTIDQPYDSLTITFGAGYELLKTATRKIYSVDSSYNHGSSYKPGDEAIKSAIHKKYQCLIETIEDPETGVDNVPPTWAELGATNRWAMFSGINTYQSVYDGDISIQLRPLGIIDSFNIFNMENVSSVQVTTSVPDTGDSYTQTYDVSDKYDLVVFDLPPYENPFIDIVFTKEPLSTSSMKIGEVVVGESKKLGTLLAGAVSDRIDYSRYTYDEFGNLEYVPRPIVKYNSYPIRIDKIDAPEVELYLDGIKGKLAVWIGDIGDGDYLIARGNLERSPMTYSNPSMIEYLIKVRGSI
ncbi:hypothetical protein NVP1213O_30 [Vibrio phage 1.213.O._10N.222.54.F10]|nr:hypothetical protein NVP1213O_30 [Vibrio phage 1.213.O._10N.222.54.F10]